VTDWALAKPLARYSAMEARSLAASLQPQLHLELKSESEEWAGEKAYFTSLVGIRDLDQ
jgi:hypothetical protein